MDGPCSPYNHEPIIVDSKSVIPLTSFEKYVYSRKAESSVCTCQPMIAAVVLRVGEEKPMGAQ